MRLIIIYLGKCLNLFKNILHKTILNKSYLYFFSFVPFGLDVFYFQFKSTNINGIKGSVFATVYTATFLILAIICYLNKQINIRRGVENYWFLIVILQLLIAGIFYKENFLGWFSLPLLIVVFFSIMKLPAKNEYLSALNVFLVLIILCLFMGLILAWINPIRFITSDPVRWGGQYGLNRLIGVFSGPGLLGISSVFIFVYGCIAKRFNLHLLCIGLLGMLASDSRAAFFSAFITCTVFLFMSHKLAKTDIRNKSMIAVLITLLYFLVSFDSFNNFSLSHRAQIWTSVTKNNNLDDNNHNFSVKNNSPISELTISNAAIQNPQIKASHAHNIILQSIYFSPNKISFILCIWIILTIFLFYKMIISMSFIPILLGLPPFIFSLFDIGIIWNRLNICSYALFLSILGSQVLSFKNKNS